MSHSEPIRRILVATDGSPGSQGAVTEAVLLAKLLGAELTILSVARPPLAVLGEPFYQRALGEGLRAAQAAVASAIPVAKERAVEYETEVVEGLAAHAILDVARCRDVDLIVVGSRGLGTVRSALLGSVSTAVVHHADRPVLVARAPAGAEAQTRLRIRASG